MKNIIRCIESIECPSFAFKCANKRCVKTSSTCDGNDDCGDNSDEVLPCQGIIYDYRRSTV